jgi:predicted hydrolase (HD superfamily)
MPPTTRRGHPGRSKGLISDASMLNQQEAIDLIRSELGDSDRAVHSHFVARLMRGLAERLEKEMELWEIVGLCHDLDYFKTKEHRHQHGLITAQQLRQVLPMEALEAIRAHDHRTGVVPSSVLAHGLKVADALAILTPRLSLAQLRAITKQAEPYAALRGALPEQEYLAEILERDGDQSGLTLIDMVEVLSVAVETPL